MSHTSTSEGQGHTPGPWKWERHDGEVFALVSKLDDMVVTPHITVCGVSGSLSARLWFLGESETADMQLIAAAPDLLRACKAAQRFIEEGSEDDDPRHIRMTLFEAIAKATNPPPPEA
jgi:hypothetical protein